MSRTFLIESLPEPLTPASNHVQIFDNYISETRLRLRSIRQPQTRAWSHALQLVARRDDAPLLTEIEEISLDETERQRFEIFDGAEIRKNRYTCDFAGNQTYFDIYLGKLWGLNTAKINFGDEQTARRFAVPATFAIEVTGDLFFNGENLVFHAFDEVREHVASRVAGSAQG